MEIRVLLTFYQFLGIDYMKAYSKKDAEKLIGDADLKKQVHLPKTSLGFCTPLGLETNGKSISIFPLLYTMCTCSPKWAILSPRLRSKSEINLMFAQFYLPSGSARDA